MAFESGVVLEDWRSYVIVPLYKGKGERTECTNYRGISLLSMIGKIYSGISVDRLLSCLLSICLDLPECTIYIHYLHYPESYPCRSRSYPFLHHLYHWGHNPPPHKLEFNPEYSRANTSEVYLCTVPHIIQTGCPPFP